MLSTKEVFPLVLTKIGDHTVADPGFPVGGRGPSGGGRGLPTRLRFEILYVKMKESGP